MGKMVDIKRERVHKVKLDLCLNFMYLYQASDVGLSSIALV